MSGVALALSSALLFGGMSVALGFSMRRSRDALVGAFATAFSGFCVCAVVALIGREWGGQLWPYFLAGVLAPGGAQLLFVLAVREAGPSRASVIAGAAPLVAVTIAILALGEPARLPLLAGAVLIVAGGLALVAERARPEHFQAIGLVYSFGCTVLFATRDNVVRHIASDSTVPPQLAASVTILSGTVLVFAVLVALRRSRALADVVREGPSFVLPGVLWGASYAFLFEAFYRSRVTIVSPLVATESLFAVLLAVLLLRRTELVGRHLLLGAALVVAGGALIGAFR
ncbi:MAG TPA: DMT family transporter [Gaiellaceae bacterium]|jgi:drug/metabolite transporter (DMT)-like permease